MSQTGFVSGALPTTCLVILLDNTDPNHLSTGMHCVELMRAQWSLMCDLPLHPPAHSPQPTWPKYKIITVIKNKLAYDNGIRCRQIFNVHSK